MGLKSFLTGKGKLPKGGPQEWLSFCTLEVTTGALWAGDPHLANAEDGCVVRVSPGRYQVEAIGTEVHGDRFVSRLRVRLDSEPSPELGEEVGETGTDSGLIAVCDIEAFDAACGQDHPDEVQEAIEAQTEKLFGIVNLRKFPGAVMPFVPLSGDGTGPVHALTASGRCVGMELSFQGEDETD